MPSNPLLHEYGYQAQEINPQEAQDILQNAPMGIFTSSPEGRFLSANYAMARMYGYDSPQEFMEMVTDIASQIYVDPADRAEFIRLLEECGEVTNNECQFRRRDGSVFWGSRNARAVRDRQGRITAYQGFTTDITDRKQAEKALQESEERYKKLINTSPDAIALVDEQGTFLTVNPAMAQRFGLTPEELAGKTYYDVMSRDLAVKRILDAQKSINNSELVCFEDSREGRYLQNYYVPLTTSGSSKTFQIISRDITESKRYEQQLQYLSLHDQLTGLYNRAYLENELMRLEKSREYPITIICMDLDGLKLINDTMGHDHGDNHLQTCARILQDSFRSSDVVARVGGDEFTALLPKTDAELGGIIVHRMQAKLAAHNKALDLRFPLSVSFGLACAEERGKELHHIYKQADDLMYRDKLNRGTTSRSQILKALMAALEERDFITSGHAQRLEELCLQLGRKVNLSSNQLSDLRLLAQVHDLGKVGIPDYILFKPGALTAEEWEIMRQHPEKGYRIAKATTDLAGIAGLILKHHERWDGQGYPLGLARENIPIECRILAIVDSFDAMTNDRPYRQAMPVQVALAEIKNCAGNQYDPYLVEVFIGIVETADFGDRKN